jgi:hypothetical protein
MPTADGVAQARQESRRLDHLDDDAILAMTNAHERRGPCFSVPGANDSRLAISGCLKTLHGQHSRFAWSA